MPREYFFFNRVKLIDRWLFNDCLFYFYQFFIPRVYVTFSTTVNKFTNNNLYKVRRYKVPKLYVYKTHYDIIRFCTNLIIIRSAPRISRIKPPLRPSLNQETRLIASFKDKTFALRPKAPRDNRFPSKFGGGEGNPFSKPAKNPNFRPDLPFLPRNFPLIPPSKTRPKET